MKCKICENRTLKPIYNFGNVPLANDFIQSTTCQKYPLMLSHCPYCDLLQLNDFVDYSRLFTNYQYSTRFSFPMIKHFNQLSDLLKPEDSTKSILEIGSNDGTFLDFAKNEYSKCIGVEPAKNIFDTAESKYSNSNVRLYNRFFDSETANILLSDHGKFDTIVACNVLAHVHNPLDFLKNAFALLKDDGGIVIEVQYAKSLYQYAAFDQVYHEHCYYFTFNSMIQLLKKAQFVINDIYEINVHGSSIRVIASKQNSRDRLMIRRLAKERKNGINSERVDTLHQKINEKVLEINNFIKQLDGPLYGLGAPAKSTIMVHMINELNMRMVSCSDTTPSKIDCFIPGSNIKITRETLYTPNDNAFVFCWNYAKEILPIELDITRDAKFIIPFPSIQIYK